MPPAWKMTEGKVAGGMVGSSMVKVAITPKTIPFMDNLVNHYKVGPIFGSHTTYDTLYGFKKAIEKAGGTGNVDTIDQTIGTGGRSGRFGDHRLESEIPLQPPLPQVHYPYCAMAKGGNEGHLSQGIQDRKLYFSGGPEEVADKYRL